MVTIDNQSNNRLILVQSDLISRKFDLYRTSAIIQCLKGENASTCDPWTARDFMEDMRKHSAQCQHCLSGINYDVIDLLYDGLVWM